MYLKLYQIKKHLNISDDFHSDDEYLVDLATVCEKVVEKHIDIQLAKLQDGEGNLPSPLIHAILLLIGNFYANRESITFAQNYVLGHGYDYLLDLYKDYSIDKGEGGTQCKRDC